MKLDADRIVDLRIGCDLGAAAGHRPSLTCADQRRADSLPPVFWGNVQSLEIPYRRRLRALGLIAQAHFQKAGYRTIFETSGENNPPRIAGNLRCLTLALIAVHRPQLVPKMAASGESIGDELKNRLDGETHSVRSALIGWMPATNPQKPRISVVRTV